MSNQELTPQDNPERSLLGSALSNEFSERSIAATDLSKQVNERMQGLVEGKYITAHYNGAPCSRYIIGQGDEPQRLVLSFLNNDYFFMPEDWPKDSDLVIAQRLEQADKKAISRRLFGPRRAVTQHTVGDPMLAVHIGNDALLPIATFAHRENGQCSYVQLGEEMHDDNFYVTTADDHSTQHDLIEAIRRASAKRSYYNKDDKDIVQANKTIQEFAHRQLGLKHEVLAAAYEQQLARKLFARMSDKKLGQTSLTVVGEDGAKSPQPYRTSVVIPKTILFDHRQVSLVAGCPVSSTGGWNTDRVGLFATTRNGVATQIASVSRQFMRLEYESGVQLTQTEHEKIVRDLLFTIIYRPAVKDVVMEQKEEAFRDASKAFHESWSREYLSLEQLDYLFRMGALSQTEVKHWYAQGADYISASARTTETLNNFYMYPDAEYNPYPTSPALELALARREVLQAKDRQVLSTLKVGERLQNILGEVRKCDEVLMNYVAKLALRGEGVVAKFNDEQIGKTKAAAVIAAKVNNVDNIYDLLISGRPASMPDEDLKLLKPLSAMLDQTQPYLGQEKRLDKGFSESNVKEIIRILSRLFLAQVD